MLHCEFQCSSSWDPPPFVLRDSEELAELNRSPRKHEQTMSFLFATHTCTRISHVSSLLPGSDVGQVQGVHAALRRCGHGGPV